MNLINSKNTYKYNTIQILSHRWSKRGDVIESTILSTNFEDSFRLHLRSKDLPSWKRLKSSKWPLTTWRCFMPRVSQKERPDRFLFTSWKRHIEIVSTLQKVQVDNGTTCCSLTQIVFHLHHAVLLVVSHFLSLNWLEDAIFHVWRYFSGRRRNEKTWHQFKYQTEEQKS